MKISKLLCKVGFHKWSKGSPWREGAWRVKACDRCGPVDGWREFWYLNGRLDRVLDWKRGELVRERWIK
jgi:hypothetical protein